MEEHDDWKLGDDGEPVRCPRCGKPNRAGLAYCTICGNALADELETDPGSLRTIGEAMGGAPGTQGPEGSRSLRAWTIAAGLLLGVVVALTWVETREEPFRLEDWLAPAPATVAPTRAARPLRRRSRRASSPPTKRPGRRRPRRSRRPEPTAVVTAVPTRPIVRPTRTAARSSCRRLPPRRPVEPDAGRGRGAARPAAGRGHRKAEPRSDLQDATRAYRQAVETHNARVDEYNSLADEIQRRNAWDDSEASVELRRRLDRAREAVESARVQAEMLRARMESVRARYR